MQSLGSLLVGVIAQALGEPPAIALAAAALAATALAIYLFNPALRRLE